MKAEPKLQTEIDGNIQQAVPFFRITNMEASLRFYVDGLGFQMKHKWIDNGKLRWCWLERGGAALMLQEYLKERVPTEKLGVGLIISFQCKDALALYHEFKSRGIEATEPFVGNHLWVTSALDPDGFNLEFESPTDVPEETKFSEWKP
jgi:lactoylglutathione lyase